MNVKTVIAQNAVNKIDENSFMKAEIAKKQRILDSISRVLSDEDAMKQSGGIQEAAAVFSYAGMDIFAQSFGNSVQRIFREETAPMMREIVREVLKEEIANIVRGLLIGQQSLIEEELAKSMQIVSGSDCERLSSIPEEAPPAPDVICNLTDVEILPEAPKKRSGPRSKSKQDAELIATLLQVENRPMRLKEITEALPDINFGKMATNKMYAMMRADENIKSLGGGLYEYTKGIEDNETA